jgi:hypothetical protein
MTAGASKLGCRARHGRGLGHAHAHCVKEKEREILGGPGKLTEQLPFPGWDEIAPVNSCARCGVTIVAWDIRCKKCARLCLDCDKDTVTGDGDYYMVRGPPRA